jgi:antirestriction protein ArdC
LEAGWKMRVGVRDDLDDAGAYAVLCHELAHIYLGHVGADRDGWWPFRMNLSEAVAEIEAESVAHIVCQRAGLHTNSAEYLSSFVEDSDDLDAISLDLISRVAGKIEDMSQRLLPPRTEAEADEIPNRLE